MTAAPAVGRLSGDAVRDHLARGRTVRWLENMSGWSRGQIEEFAAECGWAIVANDQAVPAALADRPLPQIPAAPPDPPVAPVPAAQESQSDGRGDGAGPDGDERDAADGPAPVLLELDPANLPAAEDQPVDGNGWSQPGTDTGQTAAADPVAEFDANALLAMVEDCPDEQVREARRAAREALIALARAFDRWDDLARGLRQERDLLAARLAAVDAELARIHPAAGAVPAGAPAAPASAPPDGTGPRLRVAALTQTDGRDAAAEKAWHDRTTVEQRRAVRAWAAQIGVPCPPTGYIPVDVYQAHAAAHPA